MQKICMHVAGNVKTFSACLDLVSTSSWSLLGLGKPMLGLAPSYIMSEVTMHYPIFEGFNQFWTRDSDSLFLFSVVTFRISRVVFMLHSLFFWKDFL